MRHLVLGGGGFVGRHLVSVLRSRGDAVHVVDRSPKGAVSPGTEWTAHDLAAAPLPAPLPAADVAYCLVGTYRGTDAELFTANVSSLHHALSSLGEPPQLVVYVGAGSVYGDCEEAATEERPPRPSTVYGLAKWLAESVLAFHASRIGFPWVVLRPTNVYGPGNRKNVFWAFYDAYRRLGEVTIYGDGSQTRDFVYIDDFVDLLIRAADPARRPALANQVLNVAGSESHSLMDVLRTMSAALGRDIPYRLAPTESGVLVNFRMSIAKAERLAGWRPKVPFQEGVRATIASYVAG